MVWSDGQLAALVDQLGIDVVAMGADSRITLWNAEAERLTGFSAGQAVGALATELEERLGHTEAGRTRCGT